ADVAPVDMRVQSVARLDAAWPYLSARVEAHLIDVGRVDAVEPEARAVEPQRARIGHDNIGGRRRRRHRHHHHRNDTTHAGSDHPQGSAPKRASARTHDTRDGVGASRRFARLPPGRAVWAHWWRTGARITSA